MYVPLFTSSSRHDVNMFTFFFFSFSVFDHSILSHVPLVATPLSTSFCDHDKLCSLFFNFIFPFRLSIGAHAPLHVPFPGVTLVSTSSCHHGYLCHFPLFSLFDWRTRAPCVSHLFAVAKPLSTSSCHLD